MDAKQGGKATSPLPIDTLNRCLVTAHKDRVLVVAPQNQMTRAEALCFAAWVVVMAETIDAEPGAATFDEIAEAVRGT